MNFPSRGIWTLSLVMMMAAISTRAQTTAIAIGRFRIKNSNGSFYGKEKWLLFQQGFDNLRSVSTNKKDSGYFIFRIIPGYNKLIRVIYQDGGSFAMPIAMDYAQVKIEQGKRIYYIGDIIVTWNVGETDYQAREDLTPLFLAGDAGKAIAFSRKVGVKAPITVTKEDYTIARFARLLQVDTSGISVSLLTLQQ